MLANKPEHWRGVDLRGSGRRLGHGARAVGDGEGGCLSSKKSVRVQKSSTSAFTYLRDGVGGAAVGELGGLRAVGGEGSDDLSHIVDSGILRNGNTSETSGSGNNSETHLDGIKVVNWLLKGVVVGCGVCSRRW